MTDIVCGKCGRHFSSFEDARAHRGECKGAPMFERETSTPKDEQARKIHQEIKITDELCPNCREYLYFDSFDLLYKCPRCRRAYALRQLVKQQPEEPVTSGILPPGILTENNPVGEQQRQESAVSQDKKSDLQSADSVPNGTGPVNQSPKGNVSIPHWFIALLLTFALTTLGFIASLFVNVGVPYWLVLGFSIGFSVDHWYKYEIRRHGYWGRAYRLFLNLFLLATLGFLIWTGVVLFTQENASLSVGRSVLFILEIVLFVWAWRLVAKYAHRSPSMKLTVFCLVCLFLIFAFAGVAPFAGYKNQIFGELPTKTQISSWFAKVNPPSDGNQLATAPVVSSPVATIPNTNSVTTVVPTGPVTSTTTASQTGFNSSTGTYKNYFLGLVYDSVGVVGGNDCYGQFIVLINNKNATNPTYDQLLKFLLADRTDQYPYQYTAWIGGSYYGTPESKIDLDRLKQIIDGTLQPTAPRVCADFAERLHNDAEMAGIRCGYVIIDSLDHACDVFQTTDHGLVYIDDTGKSGYGPSNCDKQVQVVEGRQYVPVSLFPESGWNSTWDSLGIINGVHITWDGVWN